MALPKCVIGLSGGVNLASLTTWGMYKVACFILFGFAGEAFECNFKRIVAGSLRFALNDGVRGISYPHPSVAWVGHRDEKTCS